MGPRSGEELETVIGLEVHVQLRTRQKLFCPDRTAFGEAPNSDVCPVCLGLPGALPVPNPEAVELAVLTALAFGCTIHRTSLFARKNYFYPDLPKGYQITQYERPLATGGRFRVELGERARDVRIRRIHLEEDAGKSLHDRFPDATAVDLNRAGTPLVELVTEPDLRSPAEARGWLQELKRVLEYLDVSDCNMEEGSLRVDANISIRTPDSPDLGTKTEVKNMNSFSGVERALEAEVLRQRGVLRRGGRVEAQTMLWDQLRGNVRPIRSKEESQDYRYFPDPDLPPLVIPRDRVDHLAGTLPELPRARRTRLREEHGLPDYDAQVLTATRRVADYFEEVARQSNDPKEVSNWVMGPVLALMKEGDAGAFPVPPDSLAELIREVASGRLSRRAAKDVLARMTETGRRASEIMEEEGVTQIRDPERLAGWVEEALAAHPEEAARLRAGEGRLRGYFVGVVMERSAGRADPREVARLLEDPA